MNRYRIFQIFPDCVLWNYLFSILDALFISMPVIGEIFIPEALLWNTRNLEFSVRYSYPKTPFMACIPIHTIIFSVRGIFDNQLFILYNARDIILYTLHLLNKFTLHSIFL